MSQFPVRKVLWFVAECTRGQRVPLVLTAAAATVYQVASMNAIGWVTSRFVGGAAGLSATDMVMLALLIVAPALFFLRDWAASHACSRVMAHTSDLVVGRVLDLSRADLTDASVGGLTKVVLRSTSAIEELFDRTVYSIIPMTVLVATGTGMVAVKGSPHLLLMIAFIVGALVVAVALSLTVSLPNYAAANDAEESHVSLIADVFLCAGAVQEFGTATQERHRTLTRLNRWIGRLLRAWIVATGVTTIVEVGLAAAFLVIVKDYFTGNIGPTDAATGAVIWVFLRGYAIDFASDMRILTRALGALGGPAQLFATDPSVKYGPAPAATHGAVALRAVTFAYADRPVLHDFTLEIPAGQSVALVGPSGSGKSTVAKLIQRIYDPEAGTVWVGNRPVCDYTHPALSRSVVSVSQFPALFNRTIWENVTYGLEHCDGARVVAAMERARVTEISNRLPNGVATVVGEGGAHLSGGERQRIAIARAILRNAPVLILDEATSALDTISEHHVQDAIRDAARDRTVIVIAHRLSTIRWVDRVVVLDNGAIVQDGSPHHLSAIPGLYRELCTADARVAHC